VLQCVAVCCSVLQCVAVCCSVLQSHWIVTLLPNHASSTYHSGTVPGKSYTLCRVPQCVAVCCSVLQCVAVCCRVLQSHWIGTLLPNQEKSIGN